MPATKTTRRPKGHPLPRFSQPQSRQLDEPLPEAPDGPPEAGSEQTATPPPPSWTGPTLPLRSPYAPDAPAGHDPSGNRPTGISTTGEVIDPEQVAKVVGGLVKLLAAGAAWLLRRTRRVELRQPTREQLDGFAGPVASILMRHFDATAFTPDLVDVTLAASAAGVYAGDGPLLLPLAVDPGLPPSQPDDQEIIP